MPNICDYEGSRYREEFWTPERRFEDLADRAALRALLPPSGETLIEVGAGFGRLADLYQGYQHVILFDYALSLLREAREQWGGDPRFLFVAGDLYHLPLASATVETTVMVRVLHHLEDVPAALAQLARITRAQGTLVLEHANKRHLKAVLRYLLRRQDWSPFTPEPHPFVPLNYDFHPDWVREQLQLAGFHVEDVRAVSHFRIPWLKRHISPELLARLDALLQRPAARFQLSPSLFLRARRLPNNTPPQPLAFRCPTCGHEPLPIIPQDITCPSCGAVWPYREGIHIFRT
ncbi:MAG: methyltransferase domain-containing protein [Chloroflexi bacterium]|nr:methyltransferase domain-containing protein [Chloroflexota bacterium]